jgi:hypothetical protein
MRLFAGGLRWCRPDGGAIMAAMTAYVIVNLEVDVPGACSRYQRAAGPALPARSGHEPPVLDGGATRS